jgi:DNA mismatch repair protein MutS
MMAQYAAFQDQHPDCIVLFRMGDFYEVFFDNAKIVADCLKIQLTERNKNKDNAAAMCGIPWHQLYAYVPMLLEAGHKVAIAEQMETPEEAALRTGGKDKVLLRREVIRVLTPGTVIEESLLSPHTPHFLCALAFEKDSVAVAWCDVSTNDAFLQTVSVAQLPNLLYFLDPKELLVKDQDLRDRLDPSLRAARKTTISPQPASLFFPQRAQRAWETLYKTKDFSVFAPFSEAEVIAFGVLLQYLGTTGCGVALKPPQQVRLDDTLRYDMATAKNLELFAAQNGGRGGSLLSILDTCQTGAGRRLLRDHLMRPLMQAKDIESRWDAVTYGVTHPDFTRQISEKMTGLADVRRILTRLAAGAGQPRDLIALMQTLSGYEHIKAFAASYPDHPPLLVEILAHLPSYSALGQTLALALNPDPTKTLREGGVIRTGYHGQLDALRAFSDEGERHLLDLENRYQALYPKAGLRYKSNNLLGVFLECAAKNAEGLPKDLFIHRQSLANAIRYTTVEMQEIEARLSRSTAEALALEKDLFSTLITQVLQDAPSLSSMADSAALLDVMLTHARNALAHRWCRPTLTPEPTLIITAGRHPVVESLQRQSAFVPNDTQLKPGSNMIILTGPNMAGKSTYLRQNALMMILAQMGSFVPARAMTFGLCDRVFCRVGAADDLASGKSTFMVEMTETATILHQATPSSLVIMDEMGRGTATFDGLSLAWSTLEYLHDGRRPRTLFATHYHELAELPETRRSLRCMQMDVATVGEDIQFLHSLSPGAAAHSYGLHVARLAGVPSAVIARASVLLKNLESLRHQAQMQPTFLALTPEPEPEPELLHPVLSALSAVDPDTLTPLQALGLISQWRSLL